MKSGLYRTESWNEEMFLSRDNLAFALEVELEDTPGDIYKLYVHNQHAVVNGGENRYHVMFRGGRIEQ